MPESRKLENIIESSESTKRKLSMKMIGSLWETHHVSPFAVARTGGYYGANKLMTNYVNRRFKISQEEKIAIKNLLLQTNMQNQSSEVAITMILQFGAWARYPQVNQIKHVSVPI